MTANNNFYDQLVVPVNKPINLVDIDPRWLGDGNLKALDDRDRRSLAHQLLEEGQTELARAQDRLYADNRFAVLIILEGMAGADLDGVIRRVMSGVNPQGCQVEIFGKPSSEELEHDFLWRYIQALPSKGNISVFKNSYYSKLVTAMVEGNYQSLHTGQVGSSRDTFIKNAVRSINSLEQHLNPGTLILKFFLHISIQEQRRRFLKWLDDPAVRWRFTNQHKAQHEAWDAYQAAYQSVINATSKQWGQWHILPSDHEWVAPTLVVQILTDAIEKLKVDYPVVSDEQKAELEEGRRRLMSE